MTVEFSVHEIGAIMLDIEGLKLPSSANYPALKLVLGLIDDYSGKTSQLQIGIDWGRIEVPDFMKAQAARGEAASRPDLEKVTDIIRDARVALTDPRPKGIELNTGPWSQGDQDHLVAQRANGAPFKEIAAQLNRPLEAALAALKVARIMPVATPPAAPAAASKHVGKIKTAPVPPSKAEGGKGILPRPCRDDNWPIEDDLDLVSKHHRGISMLDVSITLERTKPECVKRYNVLMDAMPAGPHTERQIKLKQTLAYHANLSRAA